MTVIVMARLEHILCCKDMPTHVPWVGAYDALRLRCSFAAAQGMTQTAICRYQQ